MVRLSEIMTSEVKAISGGASLRDLAEFFVEEEVSGAPVLVGDKVVGVVSVTDLVEFDAENRAVPAFQGTPDVYAEQSWRDEGGDEPARYFAELWENTGASVRRRIEAGGSEWNTLEEHTVDEVMTRRLLFLTPAADVSAAASMMIDTGVHRVLIMDDDKLAGLVTTTDIVRAVAERGLKDSKSAES